MVSSNQPLAITYVPVPDRDVLHRTFRKAQRRALIGEFVLWGVVLLCFAGIDWLQAYQDLLYSLVALAIVPFQLLPGVIMIVLKKKKKIEDLSESARFGHFDKHVLRRITNEVMDKLEVPRDGVNVFITNDKELNAYAVSVGLSRFLPQFRGVYLNRQTLHLMSPQELKSWIGHELGHLYPYALRWDEAIILRLIAGAMLALFVFQTFGVQDGTGFMIVFGVSAAFVYLTSLPRVWYSQAIEYLCDEFGCKASGANAAVTDLLRASREGLAHFNLMMYVQELSAEGKTVSEKDALRVYEESLGYGPTDIERTQQRIHEVIRERRKKNGGLSLRGLLDFMWNDPTQDSDAAKARDALRRAHKQLQKIPTIDWFSHTDWDGHSILRDDQIDDLVQNLLANPDRLLVPLIEEAQSSDDLTHPSHRNRIIYLWQNRKAIEEG